MTYLKAVLVGIIAAVAAAVLYILAVFVLPILVPLLLSRVDGSGSGAAVASFSEAAVLGIAVIAFAAAFYWQVRKDSTVRRRAR